MGTTAQKLTYLNGTKSQLKDMINYGLDSESKITNETTFREYVNSTFEAFIESLRNPDTLFNNLPKVIEEDTSVILNNTANAPMKMSLGASELEQRNLPEGYTQLEYLRSSGTQYIDLGYKGNGNTKVEIKFKYYTASSVSGSGRVFGSRTTSTTNAFAIGTSSGIVSATATNKVFWCYDSQPFFVADETFGLNEWETIVFSATEHTINGTSEGSDYNITTFETPQNLKLFGFDNNGSMGVGYVDIVYCKLWNNGVLVRDLIPAYNGTVYGMYDRVSKSMLLNAGTGTFTAGSVAVPTPDVPQDIHTISGSNSVVVEGKNLLNPDYMETTTNNVYFYRNIGVLLKANTTYTLSYKGSNPLLGLYFKEYGTNTNLATAYTKYFLSYTPTEDIKVWFDLYSTDIDTAISNFQLESGSTATPYAPHEEQTLPLNLGTLEYCKIGDYADEFIRTSGKNLLNKEIYELGKFIGADGVITSNVQNFLFSDYANVEPNTTYTISANTEMKNFVIAEYNSNKTWLKNTTKSVVQNTSFTTDSNTKYIRVSCNYNYQAITKEIIDKLDIMLNEGSTALPYEPYGSNEWYLKKNTRHLSLAIADMNNAENYPGWKELAQIKQDFPNSQTFLSNAICNIFIPTSNPRPLILNTIGVNAILYINTAVVNLTQTEWKTNYPDLIMEVYYVINTPEYYLLNKTLQSELETQLENIYKNALSYEDQTNISQTNNDLPFIINASAIQNLNS